MKTKKTIRMIELTVETDEVLVVRGRGGRSPGRCAVCGGRGGMLRPEEAAAQWGTSVREVYRRVESGRVHFAEQTGGQVFVCVNSLA